MMVTETDKKLAESMRSLGRVAFDCADVIDPPEPMNPCEFCNHGWGSACGDKIFDCRDACQELSNYYDQMKIWKAKQEE